MHLFNKQAKGLANQSLSMSTSIKETLSLEELSSIFLLPKRQNQQSQNLQRKYTSIPCSSAKLRLHTLKAKGNDTK